MQVYGEKLLLKLGLWDRELLYVKASVAAKLFICVCSALWQRVTSVSRICL